MLKTVFSSQQLIDCVPVPAQTGCKQNINVLDTLNYVMDKGIEMDYDYPFVQAD